MSNDRTRTRVIELFTNGGEEGINRGLELIRGVSASFTEDINTEGIALGGEALSPTDTATTVRIREGSVSYTDGPFAETKEQLGGFYLIDVEDLDAALAVAARIPGARTGSIEVRPVWVFN